LIQPAPPVLAASSWAITLARCGSGYLAALWSEALFRSVSGGKRQAPGDPPGLDVKDP
jgi:hypothetical protein